jgi:hypothetical protein
MRTCRTSSGEDPDEDCSPPPFFFPRGIGVPPFFRCAFVAAPCFCFFFFFVSTFVPSRSAFSAFKTVTAAFTSSSWFVFPSSSFRPFTTAACLAILPSMVVVSSSRSSSSSSPKRTTELELELELELESVAALLETTLKRCWWCSRRTPRVFVVVVVVGATIEKDADDVAKFVVGVFLRPRRRIDDDDGAWDAIGSAGGDNIIIIVIIFGLVVVVVVNVRVFPLAKKRHAGEEDHEVVVVVLAFRFFVAVAEAEKKKTKTFSTTFFPASMQKLE